MSSFSSKPIKVDRPAGEISDKFSDLTQLQSIADQLPDDERAKLGEVQFTPDAIEINTAQVGKISFEIVERTPHVVKFKAVGAPVNVEMHVNLEEVTPTTTDVSVNFDMQIPAMLRPLVAPHMQKAVDMIGNVIAHVASK